MTTYITYLSILLIVGAFIYFLLQASKMRRCYKLISKAYESDDPLQAFDNCKLSILRDTYKKSICIKTYDEVVAELKNSMSSIMEKFKKNLYGDATHELEELASSLGRATQAMADFPRNMENISATLQVTIEEVKNAISEISNTSANTNNVAMA